jgi:periplasmic mercuric ion binding protein
MRKIKLLLMSTFTMLSLAAFAQDKTDSVKVYGNCEMCKTRIEKAAKIEGVKKGEWNEETKMLVLTL